MFSRPAVYGSPAKLLCLALASFVIAVSSSAVAQGRSSRGALSRVRAMQQQQKQQTIKVLQAELTSAQNMLSQAESQLATSAPALQSAKGQLESAKERLEATEKEAHEAMKKHRELEEQLVASQSPETPVGKSHAQLTSAQLDLDKEVHRVLSLPDHPAGTTEADRAHERLALSEAQKTRLKADAGYVQANEKVEAMKSQVKDVHKQLFESDAGWKESHAAHLSMVQDLKALEENRKEAAAEVAVNMKHVKAAQSVMANAQQVIMASATQLTALGSPPKAPAAKK